MESEGSERSTPPSDQSDSASMTPQKNILVPMKKIQTPRNTPTKLLKRKHTPESTPERKSKRPHISPSDQTAAVNDEDAIILISQLVKGKARAVPKPKVTSQYP
jgi:hypothetical protein